MDLLNSLPLKENGPWILAALVFGSAVVYNACSRRKLPTPPGPTRFPIVGNALQMPTQEPWRVFAEWSKQYGDMIYLEALGQRLLVVNSLPTINTLLTTRATNYSDRAWSPVMDLAGGRWSFSEKDYGDEWRDHRRAFHQHFNHTQSQHWRPIMEEEVCQFMKHLLERPKDFKESMRLFFGMTIMRISYGANTKEYNESLVRDADAFVKRIIDVLTPGRLWVSIFPWMRHIPAWFPGAGWKRYLGRIAKMRDEVIERPWKDTWDRVAAGEDLSLATSFAKELISALPDETDPRYEYMLGLSRDVSAISYLAGADTTGNSALALILALAMHPEVQRKAQEQLDEVLGSERLPAFEDLERLPYIHAIVKEVSRWHSVLPLGVPHLSREEDELNGFRIPAKTAILYNTWAIMHDPEVFDDPMAFNPDRYLKDGQLIDPNDISVLDPEQSAFGFGRRICPGRHVSHDSLTLVAASVLTCFKLEPLRDEFGNPMPLSLKPTSSFISAPMPYDCKITPRSESYADFVKEL